MEPESYRGRVQVRAASLGDWEGLWPLLCAMGGVESEIDVRVRFEQMLLRDDHVLLVAVTDGEASVLGYAWAQDYGSHLRSGKSVARLNDQFVAPTYRRSGTGTRLFVSVVRWVEERGVTWLQWQASSAALPFYERLGLAGDPCPDQGHPFFELDFAQADWKTQLRLG